MISFKNPIFLGIIGGGIFLFVILVLLISGKIANQTFLSLLLGNIYSLANLLIGLIFIKIGLQKSDKIFSLSLWGGFLLRLTLMLILVIFSLKFLELNTNNFIFSFLFFYFFYLFSEIFYLNSRKR